MTCHYPGPDGSPTVGHWIGGDDRGLMPGEPNNGTGNPGTGNPGTGNASGNGN